MRARIFADENRKWWTLGAVAFGLFMIMLDNTIVNVALPSIQRDLGIGLSELEWVVNGYALTFAVLMLTGGKLADLLGRRLIFIAGLAVFTAASLACGLAPSAAWLIGARIVQGVGAALMNPATLSIITATFPPRQRGTAIGIWAGTSAMDLAIGLSELEWVVNGYALTFAVLMLTGGKLADLLGRRLVFIAGLAVFTAASLACGLAPSAAWLIGARIVQGVGAALMNPATLSIITATFPPRQRGMAIGIWAGVSALALAIGPLIGGVITEQIDWSWIFFINVPIGALGIVVARLVIDESRDTSAEQRLDLPGLATSAVGLFALTYALIEANTYGWTSGRILGLFAAAGAFLAVFVVVELRQRIPMLDLSLFKNSTFAGANATMMLVALAMFGVFFFVSLFMQNILGYSATRAGAIFLPMTMLIILVAPAAGRLSDHVGARWLMGAGLVCLGTSLVVFSRLDFDSGFWDLFPGLVVGGVGMALSMTPTTAAAMGSVPVDQAGVGSAVLNSMRQVGGSLGIAVMGAIVASYVTAQPGTPAAAEGFVHGFQRALVVAAIIAYSASVVAVATVRKYRQPEGGPVPEGV